MRFNKDGKIYALISAYGKPPLLTNQEWRLQGLSGWQMDLFSTPDGRRWKINYLRRLGDEFLYSLDLNLSDLMNSAKQEVIVSIDKKVKGWPK